MPLIALQNLGCSKNLIDGERILSLIRAAGYDLTEDLNLAEIIVVNTCAFIREAQEEAIESILESATFKKSGNCKTLIVTGCFSERFRYEVASQFPEVDLWVGVNDWEQLLSDRFKPEKIASYSRELSEPVASQYIKIAEGCSHGCSFCVIPGIRGPFTSRSPESIIEEAHWLYKQGVKELILVSQDTSFYGRDIGTNLTSLLQTLLRETDFPWLRMMYLHPNYVDNTLLELIAEEQRICSYFDIPLQHISGPILKAMCRNHTSDYAYRLIEQIRKTVPDASLRSSFILGFPGEKEADFRELLQFVEFARFDKLGVFPFSPEQGTKAFDLSPRPRASTAVRRCEELMLLQRGISSEILESRIGQVLEVIIDDVSEDPDFNFEARSRFDAPEVDGKVLITDGDFSPGTITTVKIIGASDYDLFAESLPA